MSKQKLYKSTECKICTLVGLKSLLEQTKLVAENILGLTVHLPFFLFLDEYSMLSHCLGKAKIGI